MNVSGQYKLQEKAFPTPAAEFELSRLTLAGKQARHVGDRNGPDILIVLNRQVSAHGRNNSLLLKTGDILLAPQTTNYTLEAANEPAVVFRASIPPEMQTTP
jgi:mannose-6-phosphate isomerase class I